MDTNSTTKTGTITYVASDSKGGPKTPRSVSYTLLVALNTLGNPKRPRYEADLKLFLNGRNVAGGGLKLSNDKLPSDRACKKWIAENVTRALPRGAEKIKVN